MTSIAALSCPDDSMDTPPAPTTVELGAVDLAAMLNGRLCHDLISPTSALTSAVDLLDDPDAVDMRDDALELIKSSVQQLSAKLSFARVAFGAASSSQAFDAHELRRLVDVAFQKSKAQIDWQIGDVTFSKPAGRALVNLAMIAAECLPRGGEAIFSTTDDSTAQILNIDARGPRAKLRAETLSGLMGHPAPEGLVGLWIQPYYARALVRSIGGEISTQMGEEHVVLTARLPYGGDDAGNVDMDALTSSGL